jgi:hypothetical protein
MIKGQTGYSLRFGLSSVKDKPSMSGTTRYHCHSRDVCPIPGKTDKICPHICSTVEPAIVKYSNGCTNLFRVLMEEVYV